MSPRLFNSPVNHPDIFDGLKDFVERGTRKTEESIYGSFQFESMGQIHPKFVNESNQFLLVHLNEGKKLAEFSNSH